MRARALSLPCLLAVVLISPAARADVVTLTNGNELRGRVLEETDEKVVLQTAGAKLTFPRGQVASVVRDEASAAGAERRPPRSTEPAPATPAGELPAARLDMTAAHVEALTAARDRGDAEATLRLGIAHEYGLGRPDRRPRAGARALRAGGEGGPRLVREALAAVEAGATVASATAGWPRPAGVTRER